MKTEKMFWLQQITWLALGALVIAGSFWLASGGEFAGADAQVSEVVKQVHPTYQPWMSSFFEMPSGEVESGLFALQAAIGAGAIGFILGRLSSKNATSKTR